MFACEQDALAALKPLVKRQVHFELSPMVTAITKYPGKGRPAAGAEKTIKGYQVTVEVRCNETAIQQTRKRKGRFILATNDLDEQRCSDVQMLTEYKQQQEVERGFRFLKDPWFMADSVFLKSPKRIEALMMVMTLCLLVFCLENKQENSIYNQVPHPTEEN